MEIRNIQAWVNANATFNDDLQDVPTSVELFDECLHKIEDNLKNKSILVLYNIEAVLLLIKKYQIQGENIYFFTQSQKKSKLLKQANVNVLYVNIEKDPIQYLNNTNMKFDVVIGNPPFSEKSKASNKLWAKFINVSIDNLLSNKGVLMFITPSGWTSSTNIAYNTLQNRIILANFSSAVSEAFNGTGGSQRFSYFLASKNKVTKAPLCIFDEGIENIDPTLTPFAPQKSSSKFAYSISKKLYESSAPIHKWKRIDNLDSTKGVVVPMAKSPSYVIEYGFDNFDGSRYKLTNISDELGNAISNNLNLKLYKSLRWILRSGAALAGNFKQLPIPTELIKSDKDLYKYFNLTQDEINYIESTTK